MTEISAPPEIQPPIKLQAEITPPLTTYDNETRHFLYRQTTKGTASAGLDTVEFESTTITTLEGRNRLETTSTTNVTHPDYAPLTVVWKQKPDAPPTVTISTATESNSQEIIPFDPSTPGMLESASDVLTIATGILEKQDKQVSFYVQPETIIINGVVLSTKKDDGKIKLSVPLEETNKTPESKVDYPTKPEESKKPKDAIEITPLKFSFELTPDSITLTDHESQAILTYYKGKTPQEKDTISIQLNSSDKSSIAFETNPTKYADAYIIEYDGKTIQLKLDDIPNQIDNNESSKYADVKNTLDKLGEAAQTVAEKIKPSKLAEAGILSATKLKEFGTDVVSLTQAQMISDDAMQLLRIELKSISSRIENGLKSPEEQDIAELSRSYEGCKIERVLLRDIPWFAGENKKEIYLYKLTGGKNDHLGAFNSPMADRIRIAMFSEMAEEHIYPHEHTNPTLLTETQKTNLETFNSSNPDLYSIFEGLSVKIAQESGTSFREAYEKHIKDHELFHGVLEKDTDFTDVAYEIAAELAAYSDATDPRVVFYDRYTSNRRDVFMRLQDTIDINQYPDSATNAKYSKAGQIIAIDLVCKLATGEPLYTPYEENFRPYHDRFVKIAEMTPEQVKSLKEKLKQLIIDYKETDSKNWLQKLGYQNLKIA